LQQTQPENFSVIVRDIPDGYVDNKRVMAHFTQAVPGSTCRVAIVSNVQKADSLFNERKKLAELLENAKV